MISKDLKKNSNDLIGPNKLAPNKLPRTCIRSLTMEGHAAFDYQKIFINALKSAYLNLSEYFDQEKIAQKIILLEMPLIQVEGFLNLK